MTLLLADPRRGGGGALVEFEPVAAGPVEVDHLATWGVVMALAFVASLALAARLARRHGLPVSLAGQAHAAAAFAGVVGAWLPALVRSRGEWMDDPAALLALLASPGSAIGAATGALAVLLVIAWGSRRGLRVADVLAPGAALVVAAVAARPLLRGSSDGLGVVTGAVVVGALAAALLGTWASRRADVPQGVAAATVTCVLAVAVALSRDEAMAWLAPLVGSLALLLVVAARLSRGRAASRPGAGTSP